MATFNKINAFTHNLGRGIHNFSANTSVKVALSNVTVSAGMSTFSQITEITAGNGYAAGGEALSGVTWSTNAGTARLKASDLVITATGGTLATFRWVVFYDDKAASDELVGFYDFGTAVSITDTNTFTVDIDPTNGIITVA